MMYTATLSVTFLTIVSTYQQTRLEGERFIWAHGFIVHNPPLQNGSAAAGVCVCEAAPVASCDGMMGVCKTDSPKLSIPEPLETA